MSQSYDDDEAPKTKSNEAAAGTDVENPPPAPAGVGLGISAITRRWRREDLLKRGSLIARGLALFFSLLSFIIMATNEHGGWKNFHHYEEYRYLLAIAILSTLYTAGQVFIEIRMGKQAFDRRTSAMVDFFGDQLVAYLLISSTSSAIPLTNRMREGQDNIFTDSSASAISISFFAFLSLAVSAAVSGYKLSSQSYI